MVKEFNNLEEIQKYYNKGTNTYVFKEDNEYIDLVIFNFDLNIKSNIKCRNIVGIDINALNIDALNIDAINIDAYDIDAGNIDARDINTWNIRASRIRARDINACDISAWNINAYSINYFAVCFAYENIKCKSIKGRRENAKHFVLDGKIEITEEE